MGIYNEERLLQLNEVKEKVLKHVENSGFFNIEFYDDSYWFILLSSLNGYIETEGVEYYLSYGEMFNIYRDVVHSLADTGKRISKFSKVSVGQYLLDGNGDGNGNEWSEIKLPKRATTGSAGYDFYAPFDFTLRPGESIKIPTGIRCKIKGNWVLKLYPRSGHGFKYLVKLANTVGIIDSDYYNSDNEGHIMVKLVNTGDKDLVVNKGDAFCQGIFSEYGLTVDDEVDGIRNGGFGSTGN